MTLQSIFDSETHKVQTDISGTIGDLKIREISLQSFLRRLSKSERITLRTSTDPDIVDIGQFLQSKFTVNLDDPELLQDLTNLGMSETRISALLTDGAASEKP